jgi:threonine dehydrogenase-like Zn-dependent dehydrogenase
MFLRKNPNVNATFGTRHEHNLVSFQMALDIILKKELDVAPLISYVVAIEQIGRGFQLAHTREDNARKVAIRF